MKAAMKTFTQYSAEIKESGKSIQSVNISRINKANIQPTIDAVMKKLTPFGISSKDIKPIGSTGKKATSGDLDVACLYDGVMKKFREKDPKPALAKLADKVRAIYGEAFVYFGNQVTFPCPIVNKDGKQADSFAQFDLMFTSSLDAASFFYHAPEEGKSKYKGGTVNDLMMAICIWHKRRDLGDGVTERYWYDKFGGLVKGKESGEGRKRKGFDKKSVSTDGKRIIHEILGPSFTTEDRDTFENLWKAIHSPKFVNKKELKNIIETFKGITTTRKQPMPSEVR